MGCLPVISHVQVQAAISAMLDHEPADLPADIVEAHVAECSECQAYWARSQALKAQLAPAATASDAHTLAPSADLTAAIIATVEPEFVRSERQRHVSLALARIGLVIVGIFYIGWALSTLASTARLELSNPDLIAQADPELFRLRIAIAALRVALGFGLFFAAWRPASSAGMLPIFGALWTFSFGFFAFSVVNGFAVAADGIHIVLTTVAILALGWTWFAGFSRTRR